MPEAENPTMGTDAAICPSRVMKTRDLPVAGDDDDADADAALPPALSTAGCSATEAIALIRSESADTPRGTSS